MKKMRMRMKGIKEKLCYALAIGVSVFVLFFVIIISWCGYEIKNQCWSAQSEYGGDCVESLIKRLDDANKGFRARNDAIGVLGMLGDSRALPALKSYYTGHIPEREPLDQSLSQYELRKAIDLTSGGTHFIAWVMRAGLGGNKQQQRAVNAEMVVVSQQDDPYYSLAQTIAREENLRVVEEFTDVLPLTPMYIILVASPDNLTAERLAEIGYVLKNQDYYPALGIISGSTLQKAEQLWERRSLAGKGNHYVAGDVEILQSIYEPTIFNITDGETGKIELTRENLIEALQQADYFYWTRHTGPKDWSWNEEYGNWTENDQLLADDIPDLKPVVIYSLTCSSFRPWVENAIALGFVDQGAVAYLGFVNTPHYATVVKQGLSVPGITSWSEFPLGIVAQVHNKVTANIVFRSPQLFMLGDPRIYLSAEQPYRITSDTQKENGARTLEGKSDEKGVLAVKLENGSAYDFLSIKGLTSVSEGDIFYNNKLQTLNLGSDKYVLFLHDGGSFEIQLIEHVPLGWIVTDAVIDAFDFSWVALWLSTYADSNPHLLLLSLPVLIGILLVKLLKEKRSLKPYARVFVVALSIALLHLAYFLLRSDSYTVSDNLESHTTLQIALGTLGIFACVAGGLMIMKDAKKRRGKALGLIFTVLRQFWLTGFNLVFITILNVVTPVTRNTETWLLSYDAFWLSLIPLVVEGAVIFALYRYVILRDRIAEPIS
ncbi:MAG: hypothetical protein JXB07_21520 [Anaerolineae bacterium]|nr:hypothetical protein [Anaerolineae bacterium]